MAFVLTPRVQKNYKEQNWSAKIRSSQLTLMGIIAFCHPFLSCIQQNSQYRRQQGYYQVAVLKTIRLKLYISKGRRPVCFIPCMQIPCFKIFLQLYVHCPWPQFHCSVTAWKTKICVLSCQFLTYEKKDNYSWYMGSFQHYNVPLT